LSGDANDVENKRRLLHGGKMQRLTALVEESLGGISLFAGVLWRTIIRHENTGLGVGWNQRRTGSE